MAKTGATLNDGRAGVLCKCGTFTPASAWALAHVNETEITFRCPALVMKAGGPDKCNTKYTVKRNTWAWDK